MEYQLMWSLYKMLPSTRSSMYIAPSWSWFSVTMTLRLGFADLLTHRDPTDIEVLDMSSTPKSSDITIAITNGRLTLKGYMRRVTSHIVDNLNRFAAIQESPYIWRPWLDASADKNPESIALPPLGGFVRHDRWHSFTRARSQSYNPYQEDTHWMFLLECIDAAAGCTNDLVPLT